MILLLILGALGFASLPLWAAALRPGLALGWGLALLVELLLAAGMVFRVARGRSGFVGITVVGFLTKLALLAGCGVLGAATGWYSVPAFLVAFAAGAFLLHLVTLRVLMRAARRGPGLRGGQPGSQV